ncbi:MAG TPA: preprotein translocase subunit SecE [Gemmatimonadaceae bacterium]|jgi:preprotein translocase subunit SecE|nr:preprotein translocase subunit SecE [Gemmatimonadaceae bacterium]
MADVTQTGDAPKLGFIRGSIAYYHSVVAELRKVTWPDVPQVRSATIAIIIFVLIIGLMISIMDFVLNGVLVRWLPTLFQG